MPIIQGNETSSSGCSLPCHPATPNSVLNQKTCPEINVEVMKQLSAVIKWFTEVAHTCKIWTGWCVSDSWKERALNAMFYVLGENSKE